MSDARAIPPLHRKLREMRELRGWTLRQVAARVGISNPLISQIETGHVKQPSFKVVVALADFYGISVVALADLVRRAE